MGDLCKTSIERYFFSILSLPVMKSMIFPRFWKSWKLCCAPSHIDFFQPRNPQNSSFIHRWIRFDAVMPTMHVRTRLVSYFKFAKSKTQISNWESDFSLEIPNLGMRRFYPRNLSGLHCLQTQSFLDIEWCIHNYFTSMYV